MAVLTPCFSGYFLSILYSSQKRNIHVHVCVCTQAYTQILFIYVYTNTHMLTYDRVWLAWPCQRLKHPQGWQEPVMRQMKLQSQRVVAAARRKAGPRRGPVGTARPRLPPPPRSTARRPWGTPGACRELGPPRHLRHLRSSWHFPCILVISWFELHLLKWVVIRL